MIVPVSKPLFFRPKFKVLILNDGIALSTTKYSYPPYGRIVVTPKKTIQMGASRTHHATL